jgi:hypothetical protein
MKNSISLFKWVFFTVVSLTTLSLVTSILLSFNSTPSPLQISLFETCTTTWKMGFGAIVGLIGGKAIESIAPQR